MDSINRCVTDNRVSISRLDILNERAEGKEAEKVEDIATNLREVNSELLEMVY